jgi:serine/threonine-protein kinase
MLPHGRVEQLLEEILISGRTPEDVAADAPELLEELRERWEHLRRIEAQLQTLFPPSDQVPTVQPAEPGGAQPLANIPGYDITEVLGRGGMGIVYRGIHRKLERAVAIKMLLADRYATPRESVSLSREAQAIAALRHPNIVQVHDVGEVDGCPYFTMEYVDGGTLAQKLAGAPMPAAAAAEMIVTLARAVDAAHRKGIVHRDLKPANVLLTADGMAKVSDFGLALRVEGNSPLSLTQSGARIGTPSYMAPEQALGKRDSMGPSADIYSLGAILYEMLTGRPPFKADSPAETERQLLAQDPVAPSRLNSRVPADLETICLKCLQKSPSRRYSTAGALAEDVGRFQRDEPIEARRASVLERGVKWARRHPAATTALIASALILGAALAGATWWISSRAAMNREADADLRDAVQFLQRSDWAAADRAIDRAALRIGARGSPDLHRRLDEARRDSALAAKLIAIKMSDTGEITSRGVSDEKAADEYAAAFAAAGLAHPHDEPERVAQRVRESNIRTALSIALDDWALSSLKGIQNAWLREVIQRTSPNLNGWRDRALDPQTYRDPAKRKALMGDAPITRESLPLLNSVGRRLKKSKEDVIPFLTRIQEAYPDDFWANEGLATALFDAGRVDAAIAYERAALAIRPNVAWVHFNLAGALALVGDMAGAKVQYEKTAELAAELAPDSNLPHAKLGYMYLFLNRAADALPHWQEAVRLTPKEPIFHMYLADTYVELNREKDAENSYRAALALDPKDLGGQIGLRRVLLRRDDTDAAIALWRQSIDDHADNFDAWDGFAEYCLYVNRIEDYRRARSELLSRFRDSQDSRQCEHVARACLMLPASSDDELHRATAMIDRAISTAQSAQEINWTVPYCKLAKALADFRAGNFESAASLATGDAAKVLQPAPQLIAAMARFRLGQTNEARQALAQAIASFDWTPQRAHADDDREVWIYHILRREAEALITAQR